MIEIIFESFNSLFHSIDIFLQTKDLTLGAILAGLSPFIVIYIKISKEKEKKARSKLIERRQLQIAFNVNEILEALKVESKWSLQEIGSSHAEVPSLKRLFSSLPKEIIQRRKQIMNKLKSRKLWLAIFGALFPVLNVELGIDLDPNVVFAVLGVVVSGIAALAHVDGKKAQAVVKELKSSVPIDPSATYKDLFPTIKAVHEKVNILLEKAKLNDIDILAAYPQLLDLLKSFEHPEPIEPIEEHET